VDYSGYPDCRPAFIKEFENLANVATAAIDTNNRYVIHAPLIHLKKSEIVQLGTGLGVDYSKTVSCYKASDRGEACGTCDSCVLRAEGFREAGLKDPTIYRK
jgi:Predicted PP-loop superfamily ATPase